MAKDGYVWDDANFDEEIDDVVVEEELSFDVFDKVDDNEEESNENIPIKKHKNFDLLNKLKSSSKLILITLIVLIIIIGYNTINVFTFTEFKTNELIFIQQDSLLEIMDLEIGESYSRSDLRHSIRKLKDSQLGDVDVDYDIKTGLLEANIEELKPLALNNGTLYYADGDEILSTKEKTFVVPVLFNFDEETLQEMLTSLNTLEYSIIKEISAIELVDEFDNNDLVVLQMNDGNYIEIYMSQISTKMPYYLQMQAIIEQDNGGKPGLIHLDIGDYYEPID